MEVINVAYNKEIHDRHIAAQKELQNNKHEHIMEEIAAMKKSKIRIFNRGDK